MRFFRNIWHWIDDRTGIVGAVKPLITHRIPPGTGWAYVFGSATLMSFILQVVSGIALATVYVSTTADAYNSVQFISHGAIFGNLLRGMHYFGASAMVVLIGIHAMQVFLWGAFKYPREVNWLVGVGLFFVTLAMAFTGQLLRWDQDSIWSVTVGAYQASRFPFIGGGLGQVFLGGQNFGAETLSHFFAYHVFFLPALLAAMIGFHLFLVIRNGISEPPGKTDIVDPKTYRKQYDELIKKEGVPFWPDAGWRDAFAMVAVIAIVIALAVILGPPELGKPPDPTIIKADPKPDWYFLWYFSTFALIPPIAQNYFIILAPLTLLVVMLAVPFIFKKGERSPGRRPWATGFAVLVGLIIVSLTILGVVEPWKPKVDVQALSPQKLNVNAKESTAFAGVRLFSVKGCEYCHQIDGQGGIHGPDLSKVAGRLTSQEITIRILNGGNNMPAFGTVLKPDELQAIVAFLETRTGTGGTQLSQGLDAPTTTPSK